MKDLLYKAAAGINRLKGSRGSINLLMYHEVLPAACAIEAWTVVREEEFAKQVKFLKENFTVIALDDALSLQASGNPLREDFMVVTFDDGYAGNYEVVFPIVQAYQFPVTVYVATRGCQGNGNYWFNDVIESLQAPKEYRVDLSAFTGKQYRVSRHAKGERKWDHIQGLLQDLKKLPRTDLEPAVKSLLTQADAAPERVLRHLTPAQVKEMSRSPLVTIGAHTHCHSLLPSLSRDQIGATVSQCRELLENWTSAAVEHFAFPNGDYDNEAIEVIQGLGFRSCVTTKAKPWTNEPVFEIPRTGVGRYDSVNKLANQLYSH
ncbi:polysaccharide deacetylase family protein [Geomonas sp. Red69]|uniref:polysaccharide deacetylase family protein n=1 Tax=Geomonas diazotrophica TaxID=2843197 RepID=UPI001C10395B|nr:polysaccharide deacetylase family protein [Geomonas diazotrophica]MBU5638118.1 polysaccharide deacetylase family protein [Geomonas diazotrophica]